MLILLLVFVSLSFGLSLEEAIKLSLENNKELQAQRIALKTSELNLTADKNLYLPEFFFSYRYVHQTEKQGFNVPPNMTVSSSKRDYQSYTLGLRQILYDGGFRASKVDLSRSEVEIQRLLVKEKEKDVALEVVKAYLDALSAKALVEVYKKQEEALRFAKERAQAFYEQGLVAITDVLQAQVKLSQAQRDLRQAEGSYRVALSRLSQLVGKEVYDVEPVEVSVEELDLNTYVEKALSKREIINIFAQKVSQAQKLQKLRESSLLPKVFLQLEYLYSDQNPVVSPKGLGLFSFGVSLNLQGLEGYYRKLSAVEEEKKAKVELLDIKEKIKLAVKADYENLLTTRDSLKVAEDGLKFAEKFFELVQEQYANQIVGMLELLDAEASLTSARKSRELSYYEYLKAYFQLKRTVGEIP